MGMIIDKEKTIINAVERMKKGEFGLTAIKVELEAQLDRESVHVDVCEDCEEGYVTCDECEGQGEVDCDACEGNGELTTDTPAGERVVTCPDCEGDMTSTCEHCDGDGNMTCDTCDGEWHGTNVWRDVRHCHDYILEKLVPEGLAERIPEGENYENANKFRPVAPLVYSRFYRDGSVDSELTFTISVKEDPSVVLKLPAFLQIFSDLAEEIGGRFDCKGAGMHMALLNSQDCSYPYYSEGEQNDRYFNFKKSMTLLLPALYFLGSNDETSRGLGYRRPKVDTDKYSAIHYNGALEFRVFDTCYDNPERVLENLVVMGNCMKYWTRTYTMNHLSSVANNIRFGVDNDDSLKRFYVTTQHIELLNRGLRLIKPQYKTISELKKERKFTVTKRTTNGRERTARQQAVIEYKEYEERFGWNLVIRKHRFVANTVDDLSMKKSKIDLKKIEAEAEKQYQSKLKDKKKPDQYIKEKLDQLNNESTGEYSLAV